MYDDMPIFFVYMTSNPPLSIYIYWRLVLVPNIIQSTSHRT